MFTDIDQSNNKSYDSIVMFGLVKFPQCQRVEEKNYNANLPRKLIYAIMQINKDINDIYVLFGTMMDQLIPWLFFFL